MVGRAITGYKAGCEFIDEKCVKSFDVDTNVAEVINEDDFCSEITKQNVCNTGLTHKGYCGSYSINRYTGIDAAFDYFNGLMMSGGTSNTDNCPLV